MTKWIMGLGLLLLLSKADIFASEKDLFKAVESGDAAKVMGIFVANPGIDVNQVNKNGETLLYVASNKCNAEVVKGLLEIPGIEVDKVDKKGETPLHIATKNCYLDILTQLLAKKSDVNKKDSNSTTPLHIAAKRSNEAVVNIFLQIPGIKVNETDNTGQTPLIKAAGFFPVVRALLKVKGIDVNHADNKGRTALIEAVEKASQDSVKALIEAGADVNHKDQQQRTPLKIALNLDEPKRIVELLLNLRRKRAGLFDKALQYVSGEYKIETIHSQIKGADPCSIDIKGYRDHIQKHGGSQGILKLLQEARKKCTETGAPK